MIERRIIEHIENKTRKIFNEMVAKDLVLKKKVTLNKPIPIYGAKEEIVSWFVAITVGDKLLGFLQFDFDLNFMRYSTFQRKKSSLEGCPDSRTWLDPKYIKNRAKSKASPGDILDEPLLSFDKNLTRIAWVVKAVNKNSNVKKIFVAGDYVYIGE